MNHRQQPGRECEQLLDYALGHLPQTGAEAVRLHVAECPACARELARLQPALDELHLAPAAVEPPRDLWARIQARIRSEAPASEPAQPNGAATQPWKDWSNAAPLSAILHAPAADHWESTSIAGVEVRQLHVDRAADRATMLIRMAPGTAWPPHRHGGPEECFVLQGDLHVGDELMVAGDYQCAEEDSVHPWQRTRSGCLLLITSSLEDELLPQSA